MNRFPQVSSPTVLSLSLRAGLKVQFLLGGTDTFWTNPQYRSVLEERLTTPMIPR